MSVTSVVRDGTQIPLKPTPALTEADKDALRRVRLTPSRNLEENRYEYARDFCQALFRTRGESLVLDIGAGECPMRAHVRGAGHQWRGFDLVPRDAEVVFWDLNQPPGFAERADGVLLLDVIEHLFNPLTALQNIASAMKPGAKLLLTTPNPGWSRSRIHLLLRATVA